MPLFKLPIKENPNANVDDIAVNNRPVLPKNGYYDEFGNFTSRPGLTTFVDLGTGQKVDGLYWWDEESILIAVSNGNIYTVTSDGTVTDVTGDVLTKGQIVSFASVYDSSSSKNILAMANGGKIVLYNGTDNTSYVSDAIAPIKVDSVISFDNILMCNETDTQIVYYSAQNDPDTWPTDNFFQAYTKSDPVTGLAVARREILIYGRQTVETWYSPAEGEFRRMSNVEVGMGVISRDSIVNANNTWYWLNEDRQIVMLNGRTPQVVSLAIDKRLQALEFIDDCIGSLLMFEGRPFILFDFPQSKTAFLYNYATNSFCEWGYWNQGRGELDGWKGNSNVYSTTWNKHLVADRRTGKIFELDSTSHTDDGDFIYVEFTTSYFDHSTSYMKLSKNLRLNIKSGTGITSAFDGTLNTAPAVVLKWRNNGGKTWERDRTITLGKDGEYDNIKRLYGLGSYNNRQWRFICTDDVKLVLIEMEEDVEVVQR